MKTTTLILAATLLLGACSDKAAPPTRGITEVAVVTLKTEAVALQNQLSGRTTAALVSEVRPQVSGIVKARRFEEGALVKAGQVLYEIDPSSYQAAADEARANLASDEAAVAAAKLKDTRYAELLAIDGVSQQDADDAHAAAQQAVAAVAQKKAALATARINLDYTQVRAPISGRIGKSSVTAGALVTASQTTALATIRALDPMYVDLTQSSAELLQMRRTLASGALKAGSANVSLKLEDGSAYALPGKLKFAEVAVDEATGSVTLRAEFPNPDGALLPGMYVQALLAQAVDPNAILAPQQGISRDPKGNATALVVTADNKISSRSVTTQRAINDKWLVSGGLQAGDRIVVEGSNKVREGDTVKPVEVGANKAEALALSSAAKTTTER
ncbi:efflux RND transporter periplasmic adaptor subunit [Variovorax sp. HJSM1_2]|uniref:efflux RND transporter periplasmic adaptor subunit n=1 Tax=Variovorax sp. HJSM1_2 TaxID=3366263 RepID=UPI003BE34650